MKLHRAVICGTLVILLICFIFSNSVQSRDASIVRSSTVMELLKPILDPHGRISDGEFHHYVRKAAHFTEFAALGAGLAGVFSSFRWQRRRLALLLPPLAALLIAVSDEVIQIFSPARGPGVRDVLLDFCGALFGIVCMRLLLRLIDRAGKKDT